MYDLSGLSVQQQKDININIHWWGNYAGETAQYVLQGETFQPIKDGLLNIYKLQV